VWGLVLLALNAYLSEPSLWAVYAISLWDGFFSGHWTDRINGVYSPFGWTRKYSYRRRIEHAGLFALVPSFPPAIAGVVIVSFGVTWNYTLAAIGTLCTLITLVTLPNMKPEKGGPQEHPIKSLLDGFTFVFTHKVIRAVVALGTLEAVTKSIRILFPALAATAFGGGGV